MDELTFVNGTTISATYVRNHWSKIVQRVLLQIAADGKLNRFQLKVQYMNPFHGRHFQGEIILQAVRWYWHNPKELSSWHIDETYVKVNWRWAYLYRAVD